MPRRSGGLIESASATIESQPHSKKAAATTLRPKTRSFESGSASYLSSSPEDDGVELWSAECPHEGVGLGAGLDGAAQLGAAGAAAGAGLGAGAGFGAAVAAAAGAA